MEDVVLAAQELGVLYEPVHPEPIVSKGKLREDHEGGEHFQEHPRHFVRGGAWRIARHMRGLPI